MPGSSPKCAKEVGTASPNATSTSAPATAVSSPAGPNASAGIGRSPPQRRGDAKEIEAKPATDSQEGGLAPALEKELKALVARDMGKPLAPSHIHFVSALPKTRNAKVMRRVIRSAYLGEDPGDLSALENPKSVEDISACRNQA